MFILALTQLSEGGNLEIKAALPELCVVGPRADASRIPGIDVQVGQNEEIQVGNMCARVFDTPGHTRGHIVYHFESISTLFAGDTLFSLGCGRLFEGTPEQMLDSLNKISDLPDDTTIYCAHEYTVSGLLRVTLTLICTLQLANARFAMSVEPQNRVSCWSGFNSHIGRAGTTRSDQ